MAVLAWLGNEFLLRYIRDRCVAQKHVIDLLTNIESKYAVCLFLHCFSSYCKSTILFIAENILRILKAKLM